MLSQTIGDLLPVAAGVALSPIPIIAVILILGTPAARSNGAAFAGGWIAGLVVVSVATMALADGAADPTSSSATGVKWFQVTAGALFLAMAARQWRSRPQEGQEPQMPAWMAAIDGFGPGRSAGFGALLSGPNPKNLALTVAGAASIAQADLASGDAALAVSVFVVVASFTVVGPVVWFLLAPERAVRSLQAIKGFMVDNNAAIMVVVLLVLGLKLLGQGLGALGS